jgi:hypothetical protein
MHENFCFKEDGHTLTSAYVSFDLFLIFQSYFSISQNFSHQNRFRSSHYPRVFLTFFLNPFPIAKHKTHCSYYLLQNMSHSSAHTQPFADEPSKERTIFMFRDADNEKLWVIFAVLGGFALMVISITCKFGYGWFGFFSVCTMAIYGYISKASRGRMMM